MKVFSGVYEKPTVETKKLFGQINYKTNYGGDMIVECSEAPYLVGHMANDIINTVTYIKFYDIYMRYKKAELEYHRTLNAEKRIMMAQKMESAVKDFEEMMLG